MRASVRRPHAHGRTIVTERKTRAPQRAAPAARSSPETDRATPRSAIPHTQGAQPSEPGLRSRTVTQARQSRSARAREAASRPGRSEGGLRDRPRSEAAAKGMSTTATAAVWKTSQRVPPSARRPATDPLSRRASAPEARSTAAGTARASGRRGRRSQGTRARAKTPVAPSARSSPSVSERGGGRSSAAGENTSPDPVSRASGRRRRTAASAPTPKSAERASRRVEISDRSQPSARRSATTRPQPASRPTLASASDGRTRRTDKRLRPSHSRSQTLPGTARSALATSTSTPVRPRKLDSKSSSDRSSPGGRSERMSEAATAVPPSGRVSVT